MYIGIVFLTLAAIASAQDCPDLYPKYCQGLIGRGGNPCNSDLIKNYYCKCTCRGGGGPRPPPPPGGSGCGKSFYQGSRVISGRDAAQGEFPWQLLLKSNGRPGCGGSLISPNWAVTAAHCIRPGSRYSIVLGAHDRNWKNGREQEIQISRTYVHPSWSQRTFNNDIALLKLSTPARLGQYVNPICLPDKNVADGTSCMISGWGKVRSTGQMHHTLQCASMTVISKNTCDRKNFANIRVHVTDQMICGGGSGRISGCQGDSGGPLSCNVGGRFELHGAVSHGSRDCDSSKTYTVFGRVYSARSWIRSQTGL